MTIKDKKELYTILWKEAKRLYAKYDLCQSNADHKSCIRYTLGLKSKPFCCDGCKHLGKHGCKVQSLSCALHCCFIGSTHFSFDTNELTVQIQDRIANLKRIAKKHGLPIFGRTSKSECFYNIK